MIRFPRRVGCVLNTSEEQDARLTYHRCRQDGCGKYEVNIVKNETYQIEPARYICLFYLLIKDSHINACGERAIEG